MVICLLLGFCCCWFCARLLRPRRIVTAHWHCFLETTPGLNGRLFGFVSVDCFAGSPFSVSSGHHVACDVC